MKKMTMIGSEPAPYQLRSFSEENLSGKPVI